MDVDDRAQLLQLDDDAKMLDDVRTASDTGDDYDDVMRLSRSPSPCSSSTSDSPLSSESPDPSGLKSAQLEEQDGERGEDDDQLDDGNEFDRFLSRSSTANLNKRIIAIFEAPEFVQRLKSYIEAELGDTVTFSAEYRAVPRPTVKWFKDEEEVRPTERHHLDESDDSDGVIRLRISDVIATDEGAYKCKVENREGVASTTGYLSVTGKPSRRTRSSRTSGKLSGCGSDKTHGGVSTPPILGPIVEQKSMEEREERELQRQPPSPLQDFIDSIRRSAKAKHAPIFYGTGDIFTVQDEGEECTASEDDLTTSEDDVFSAEETESYTPTGTPDILLDSDPDLLDFDGDSSSTPDTPPIRLCAVDNFTSPEISYNSMESMLESPQIASRLSEAVSVEITVDNLQDSKNNACCKSESAKHPVTREFQRTRLGQLQLQHRLAIDLPDSPPPINSSSQQDSISPEHTTQSELTSDNLCLTVVKRSSASPTMELLVSQSAGLDISDVVDGLVRSLDSPDVQFYVVFIACSALVASACQVPPVWLVLIVSAVSILRFCLQTRRTKLQRQSSNKNLPGGS